MSQLMLHCGGFETTLEDLKKIPLPEETDTYKPVSHYDLISNTLNMTDTFLKDYKLRNHQTALARKGQHMFFILNFQNGVDDSGLSIGGRNSYDKTTSIGIAAGMNVFVCDNLSLSGDHTTYIRKHTKNVFDDLEIMLMRTVKNADTAFHKLHEDSQTMKEIPMNNNQAYREMGLLYGKGILSPRQLPVVKKQWLKPMYEDFEDRNVWSFYNACTEGLKTTNPNKTLAIYGKLHQELVKA